MRHIATMATCSILGSRRIGELLNDACHKTVFSRMSGLKNWYEFSTDEQKSILLRSDVRDLHSVCFHHEKVFITRYRISDITRYQVFITRYQSRQKYCCDPFRKHRKKCDSKFSFILQFYRTVIEK